MKQKYSILGSILLLLPWLTTSCSLYMDEAPDAEVDPQTEVEGKDELVHIVEDNFEMTYQFKDSTFVLTERIQKYVTAVVADDSVTYSIYFLESTPANLLPERDFYVHCQETETIPYLAHKVESVSKQNGLWRVVAKYVSPFEIFETLILDGIFAMDAYDNPEEGIYLAPADEEPQLAPPYSPTRMEIDWDTRNLFSDGLIFTKSFPTKVPNIEKQQFEQVTPDSKGKVNWQKAGIGENTSGPYLQFGLKLKPYLRLYYNSSEEAYDIGVGIDGAFILTGGFKTSGKISGDLFEPIMIYGKKIDKGPINLGVGISFTVSYELSGNFMNFGLYQEWPFGFKVGYHKLPNMPTGDTYRDGYGPHFSELFQGGMGSLKGILAESLLTVSQNCTFNITPKISIGVNAGGNIPTNGVSQQSLQKLIDAGKIDKEKIADAKAETGLSLDARFGPEITFNFMSPTNASLLKSTDFLDLGLYLTFEGKAKLNVWKWDLLDEKFTLAKAKIPKLELNIGSVPKIDDKSFYVIPEAGTETQSFNAQYGVESLGFYGSMGTFRPKLAVYRDDKLVKEYDNEQKKDLEWSTRNTTFTFKLDDLQRDVNYVAKPVLYWDRADFRLWNDGIPFATKSPSIAALWIAQTGYSRSSPEEYLAHHYYYYRAKIAIKGTKNIDTWGITHYYNFNLDEDKSWHTSEHAISKIDDRDRSYYINFTLHCRKKAHPMVEIRPWAIVRYDGSRIEGSSCRQELFYDFKREGSIEGDGNSDGDIGDAKGSLWDTDGLGILCDDPDAVITIDSITPAD